MKMEKNIKKTLKKDSKGITLVALVITIIILLILAGISISALTGSGLFGKAQYAKERTRGATVKEKVEMAVSENEMAKYTNGESKGKEQVIQELYKEKQLTGEDVEYLKENDILVIGDIETDFSILEGTNVDTLVAMYDRAVTDRCTNEDGNCDREDHLHIGDYVDYKNPTSGRYTVTAEKSGMDRQTEYEITNQVYEISLTKNQLNWLVLGKDEETGGIKLISGRPMKSNNIVNEQESPYLYMYGASAYVNGEEELDNIGKLYTTSYGTGRSIKIEDIDQVVGITTENIREYDLSGSYGQTYEFENQYTPESWLNGETRTTVKGTVDGYAYRINDTNEPTVRVSNNRIYKMLFDNAEFEIGASYWLASPGVYAYSSNALFGLGMVGTGGGINGVGTSLAFYSGGNGYCSWFGARPVVVLKSNVTKTQVPKIEDKVEDTWNY